MLQQMRIVYGPRYNWVFSGSILDVRFVFSVYWSFASVRTYLLCFVFCILCFVFCVLCFVFCVLCFVSQMISDAGDYLCLRTQDDVQMEDFSNLRI